MTDFISRLVLTAIIIVCMCAVDRVFVGFDPSLELVTNVLAVVCGVFAIAMLWRSKKKGNEE